MPTPIHIVDAFAGERFTGNPAAVVLFDAYPADAVMQAIAAENNLSETAFPIRLDTGEWELRWFTPTAEVKLCGHATLASAHVLFTHVAPEAEEIVFATRSAGKLTVRRAGDALAMDFPAIASQPADRDLAPLFGFVPREVRHGNGYLVAVLETAEQLRGFAPDLAAIRKLDDGCLLITAPGDEGYDCASRFFAPGYAIDEDPVTGSAHCLLAPYWAERLGKTSIRAFQASHRGGEVLCTVGGDRVELRGRCNPYLAGTIEL